MLALTPDAAALLQRLQGAGGSGWVVGGALRDMLMDEAPGDWDIATTLTPEAVLELYPAGRLIGGMCGTVRLRQGKTDFEVTPCRAEMGYTDKRHPDKVLFIPNILEDLSRRDFTINAMAYDGEVLLDPFGGQQDIRHCRVRCVGRATTRFVEDPLRILRMLRFASHLGFGVEKQTMLAAIDQMHSIATLPRERVRAEVQRILLGKTPQVLEPLIGHGGLRRYGFYYAPTLEPLARVPANKLCRWWAFATLSGVDIPRLGSGFGFSRRFTSQLEECGRLYAEGPSEDELGIRFKLRGTTLDYGPVSATFGAISPFYRGEGWLFEQITHAGDAYRVQDLAVNGADLVAEGVRGTACGKLLEELLDAVLRDPRLNTREKLLPLVRSLAPRYRTGERPEPGRQ